MKEESTKDYLSDYANQIYSLLWRNDGHKPNPIEDTFREAIVKTAMDICHECGTPEDSARFCAETIADWMKNDIPSKVTSTRKFKREEIQ